MAETFDFGEALKRLKSGERVARIGWNGKGMWLILIPIGALSTSSTYPFEMQACIGMKTVDNKMQPGWLASQVDMLAEDWVLVTL